VIALFKLNFAKDWDKYFSKMDSSIKRILWKKIIRLERLPKARHLKRGFPIFVVESGQYRICFEEKGKTRNILFAGNHKQYQKWYSALEKL
jgi:hypothetical protein